MINIDFLYCYQLSVNIIRRYIKFKCIYYDKMDTRNLLLLSSSNLHGHGYLQYAADDIRSFLRRHNVKRILFIPYALPDYDQYLTKVNNVFSKWGFEVDGIHNYSEPNSAVNDAQSIFVGGGNTFLLLKTLYTHNLIPSIRERVIKECIPYIGTSAGTNIAAKNIHTTNDMPIVFPPSFDALQLVRFNINPHYLDADEHSKHKGETREERILQYLDVTDAKLVLAMREGVHLLVENGTATLKGVRSSRLFIKDEEPRELPPETDVTFLLRIE